MWPDNETERDFLNFGSVANTAAEIIIQAQGLPISIGVSGAWGSGKSSMIKLIRKALKEREEEPNSQFIIVEFNAWLYQGYDDARAALMEVIASTLKGEAERRKTGVEKAKELLGRVNWLRVTRLTAGSAIAMAFGLPPVGLIGEIYSLGKKVAAGEVDEAVLTEGENIAQKISKEAAGLLKGKQESSPPREIQAIRKCFEDTLDELGITLVVLIDDLDRCLPATTISTLEAMRLFLFLKNTAFVIAADTNMIKHAVRKHFDGVGDDLVTSYFDKLIQVPIRVPPLGTQEVRAYMMLLFVENSALEDNEKEVIRKRVCNQLSQSWRGVRVDRYFMETLHDDLQSELVARFDAADRLAPVMTTASQIAGNPRLIKRFLNALAIRMTISHAHGVGVDETALAKMLLFERCGDPRAHEELIKAVNEDNEGKPRFLAEWEEKALAGEDLEFVEPWDANFVREWLTLPPRLGDHDLRGILYVSREHAPLITPEDRLSSEAAELLTALLEKPNMAGDLKDRLTSVPHPEISIILDRLLDRARKEQEWGAPAILEACLVVTRVDPSQGSRLAAFLGELPPTQIKASIVPKIGSEPWANTVFTKWESTPVSDPVKKSIAHQRKNGNITV